MPTEDRKAAIARAWRAFCEAQERTDRARADLAAAQDEEGAAWQKFKALESQPSELAASGDPV
jgi:hypothetical protein